MAQTTFIGRKAELQWLEGFLKKAAGGQLQVVFIAGEAGAGKSSLVEKFIHDEEELNPTLVAFIGECNAHTGSGDPYLPFRQLLTSLITDPREKKSATETASAKCGDSHAPGLELNSNFLCSLRDCDRAA